MTKFHEGKIAERIDVADDLLVFRVALDAEYSFIPGQAATLAVDTGEGIIARQYSIGSAPHEPLLEFFIELVPDGKLTPRLWELKAGSTILVIKRATGKFLLGRDSGLNRHLMVATVTGAMPYVSMIRAHAHALERGEGDDQQFLVLHGASRSWELEFYRNELEEIGKQGWVTYIPTVSRPWEDPNWKGEVGRVDDVLRKYADQFGYDGTNSVAYACGHPTMIENAESTLKRARFPKENVRSEKYFLIRPAKE